MAEKSEIVRIPLNLYRNNPEHERVYAVLAKQKNKSAYIREAIWNYHLQGIDTQITKEDIRQIVRETCEELMEVLLTRLAGFNHAGLAGQNQTDNGTSGITADNSPEQPETGKKPIDFDRLKNLF